MTHEHQQWQHARNYKEMLINLMSEIQEYLLLSDDVQKTLAKKSLKLGDSSLNQCGDHLICVWLQQLW